ncbi:hypothetical protein L1049_015569 [Liquidambar formosana]|uniref:DNA/RNA-binding protein Alba-like domain-containing protein n=1 Tax=Liquidambar formosana TaxID=63359 RepID=A0AAP0RZY7_LIQFO
MDRYQRVEKPKTQTPINENEIRITAQGRMRNYIAYATTLLQEKGSNEIVLKAMGRAINKTVAIVELIKRRIVGLHQKTSIGSIDITDMWEPLEEGLLPLETTRHVSMITITLSKEELDVSSIGYQPPIPADQVKPWIELDYEGEASAGMRRRGRGGRERSGGNNNGMVEYGDGGWDGGRGYRVQSLGRGRNFHGHGRGYGDEDMHQEAGGYNGYGGSQAPPAQSRGNKNGNVGYGDGGWDGGHGFGGRGRGRGRSFRGRGRGYGGEDIHQGSGGYNGYVGSQVPPAQGRGNNNGMAEYGDGGWDGGRGYGGRGRGRGRNFGGHGRGYGGGEMHQESVGYNGYGGSQVPPAQGRGRGHGRRGRGRGRGQI